MLQHHELPDLDGAVRRAREMRVVKRDTDASGTPRVVFELGRNFQDGCVAVDVWFPPGSDARGAVANMHFIADKQAVGLEPTLVRNDASGVLVEYALHEALFGGCPDAPTIMPALLCENVVVSVACACEPQAATAVVVTIPTFSWPRRAFWFPFLRHTTPDCPRRGSHMLLASGMCLVVDTAGLGRRSKL